MQFHKTKKIIKKHKIRTIHNLFDIISQYKIKIEVRDLTSEGFAYFGGDVGCKS